MPPCGGEADEFEVAFGRRDDVDQIRPDRVEHRCRVREHRAPAVPRGHLFGPRPVSGHANADE